MLPKPRTAPSALGSLARSLALAALAVAASACSLIKVNGKPLGSYSSAQPDAAAASSGDGQADPRGRGAAATPGAPPAASAELCKSASGSSRGTVAELKEALRDKIDLYAAVELVDALCATEGELARERTRVQAVGKAWMDSFHLDDRDLAVLYLAAKGRGDRVQDFNEFSGPVGQYASLLHTGGLPLEALDRLGARVSTLANVALVRTCFDLALAPYQPKNDYPVLTSIVCTRAPIDLAKADEEIEATEGLNDASRQALRRDSWRASEAVRQARIALTALGEEDPGVAVLIAMADKEFAQWAKPSAQRLELVAQLEAMELAAASNKRSAFAGCEDTTVASWVKVLRAAKLPKVPSKYPLHDYLRAGLSTAEGYLAYSALRLCSEASESKATRPRSDGVSTSLQRRGPRTATIASWFGKEEPFEFDDRERTFDTLAGGLNLKFSVESMEDVNGGVIARIAEIKGGVEVTFKTVRVLRDRCTRWRETHRIRGISATGRFEYDEVCVTTSKVLVDVTSPPVRFGKAMAQGLAPGMFLIAAPGLPVVATRSAESAEPLFVLGGALR